MRRLIQVAAVVACVCTVALLLPAALPNVQTGTWQPAGNLTQPRDGAASALLQDGTVLVSGGNASVGPTATADLLRTDGTIAAVGSMSVARSKHTATVLDRDDGRVLVVGGDTGNGVATSAAEEYDPATGQWTAVGSLAFARFGHTATQMDDGRVLIAGGENNGALVSALEVYDPATQTFTTFGSLNTPRKNHAAINLDNGTVLIAGGFGTDNKGNVVALSAAEIFNPSNNSTSNAAGLNTPRAQFSATKVIDGNVVAVGGTSGQGDLASIEIYDTSSSKWNVSAASLTYARSGHVGTTLPNSNAVLVSGGTTGGTAQQTAEMYRPWNDDVVTGGAMTAAHILGSGAPLSWGGPGMSSPTDGLYFVAGGSGSTNAELFRYATIKTDAGDYAPGTVVYMTGTGFQAYETVYLHLHEEVNDTVTDYPNFVVQAGADGSISYSGYAPTPSDLNSYYHLTALGQSSGYQAQTTFHDGAPPDGTTTTVSCSPSPIDLNATTSCTANVKDNNRNGNGSPAGTATLTWTGTGTAGTFTPSNGTCTLVAGTSPNSSCSVSLKPTAAPSGTVTASYASSNTTGTGWSNSSGTASLTVVSELVISGLSAQSAGACASTGATVRSADSTGTAANASAAITVNLSTSASTTGKFYATSANCSAQTSAITSVTIASGSSTSGTFFYRDTKSGSATITAADSAANLSSGTQSETINAAAASKLAFSTNPVTLTTTGSGSCGGPITVQTQDSFGNASNPGSAESVALSSTGTSSFYTDSACSSAVPSNTLSIATSANSASFYFKDSAIETPTITATATGAFSSTPTQTETVTAGTAASGSGTMTVSPTSMTASSSSTTFTFTFTAPSNADYASGSSLTLAMPSGWTAPASNGQGATSVTSGTCTASLAGFSGQNVNVNMACAHNTSFTITYKGTTTTAGSATFATTTTASGGSASDIGSSPVVTVSSDVANKLAFTTQPSTTTVGNAISPSVAVTVQDRYGNTVTSNTSTVTIAYSGAGTFSGTSTTSVAAVNGVATFSNLVPTTSGSGLLLSASDGALTAVTSTAFTVNPGAASSFTVSAPGTATAGSAFNVTVTAKDAYGNTATGYSGTVHFTSTDGQAALPSNSTLTNGTGTFSPTLKTAGNQTITATDTVNGSLTATTGAISVSAASASKLVYGQQPTNTQTGSTITPAVTVKMQDAFGNQTASTASVTIAIGTNPGSGSLSGTLTQAAVAGVATFNDLSINQPGNGYTLAASSSGLTVATSSTFNITGTPPAITSANTTTFTVFSAGTFTVTATGQPTPTLSETGTLPSGVTFNAATGVLSGTPASGTVGSYPITIKATNGILPDASQSFTLVVQKATQATLTVTGPSSITYGNTGTATSTGGSGTGTVSYALAVGSTGCSVSGTTVSISNASGSCAITATNAGDGDYNSITSASFTVSMVKATPTLSVTNSPVVYNGSAQSATLSSSVPGTISSVQYNASATVPTSAGTYAVTANFTPTDTNDYSTLTAASAGNFVIGQATPTISVSNSPVGYNGSPQSATISHSVPGTISSVTYSGSATVPTAAGTYAVVANFTPTDTTDYTSLTAASAGNFVIQAVTPTVSVTGGPFTYDGAPHAATVAVTGVGGATVSGASTVTYNGSSTVPTTANSYAVAVTFTSSDTNYTNANGSGSITISQATPVITWSNPGDITYGTALSATQLNASANVSGALVYSPAAGTLLAAGNAQTLSVVFTPADTTDYTSVSASVQINVLKATPTLAWMKPASITYGTALSGTQLNAIALPTYSTKGWWKGEQNANDSSSLANNGVAGSGTTYVAGINAGTNAFSFPGNSTGGVTIPHNAAYDLGASGFTASLYVKGAKTSNGLEALLDKSHGCAAGPCSGSYTDATGWIVEVNSSTGAAQFAVASGTSFPDVWSTKDVLDGNYHHVVATWDGASTIALYVDGVLQGTNTVTPVNNTRSLNIGYWWNGGTPGRFFNGVVDEVQIFGAAVPTGSYTYNPASGTVLSAGPGQSLGASFSPTDSANLNSATGTNSIDVNTATLTITASDASVTYADNAPSISPSFSGFVNGDTASSLTTQSTCSTTYVKGSHVAGSPYASSCSGAAASNYTIQYTNGKVTVNPAAMGITASNASVTYGDAAPSISANYSGFLNGDTASSLTTAPACSTTYVKGSHVAGSPYATSCSGAVDTDYTISYTAGSVTVGAASLGVTASSANVDYGDAAPTVTPSYAGFVLTDTAASLSTPPSCSTTYTQGSHVAGSPYATSCSGAVDTDYTISYTAGSVTVKAVPLSITASSAGVNYGDAAPSITPSYAGFVLTDTAASLSKAPSCSTTYTQGSHVAGSPYATSCSGAVDTDYTISYTAGSVTVKAVPLSITASSSGVNYGDAAPSITPSYIGFVNGDAAASLTTAPSCSTTYAKGSHVSGSPYSTSCSGAVDTDYSISYTAGTVTVSAVPLSITASSTSVVFDAAVPSITATYSGFVPGDSASSLTTAPTCSTTYKQGSSVNGGPYPTSCTGAADGDYTIAYTGGSVTVTPANASIAVTAYNVTYDGKAHTATGTAKGPLSETLSGLDLSGTTHTDAGTYSTDSWTFTDATGNYNNTSGTVSDSIGVASTTTKVVCPTSVIYNGAAQAPCTASVSGANLTQSLTVSYSMASSPTDVGTYTASATYTPDSNHSGSSNSTTFKITQYGVVVTTIPAPSEQSYEGLVTMTASLNPAGPNGSIAATGVNFYVCATDGVTNCLKMNGANAVPLVNGTALLNVNLVDSGNTGYLAPGAHSVVALPVGGNANGTSGDFAFSGNVVPLTIDSSATAPPAGQTSFYTGSTIFWTPANSNTTTLFLSGTVVDPNCAAYMTANNGAPCPLTVSDITKAKVTFAWVDPTTGNTTAIQGATNLPVGLVDPNNHGVGSAAVSIQYSLANGATSTNLIVAVLVGDPATTAAPRYFQTNNRQYDSMITVSQPLPSGSLMFASNMCDAPNGYVASQQQNQTLKGSTVQYSIPCASTNGTYQYPQQGVFRGDAGSLANVSGSVLWGKSTSNPKGQILIRVVSPYLPNGTLDTSGPGGAPRDHVYYIKSNAISSFQVKSTATATSPNAAWSQFTSKASIYEDNGTGIDGGALLNITVCNYTSTTCGGYTFPAGTTALQDGAISVQVNNSKTGAVWFVTGWTGTTSIPQNAVTGTVQVQP